jgi:6-phosphogluconolactonase
MKVRRFSSYQEMTEHVVKLLTVHMERRLPEPRGIMLAGGLTPLPAYRKLATLRLRAAPSVHILFSDERMVPANSPENNYANASGMITAIGVPERRVIRVHTDCALQIAANRYDRDLRGFLDRGGTVGVGLLGVGADGHTASLFTMEQAGATGRLAVAVPRTPGPDRVTVTADLLSRIETLIVLVSGPDKAPIVKKLIDAPQALPAGIALARARDVALWIS